MIPIRERFRRVESILFDLDGVIVDSFDSWVLAITDLLDEYNMIDRVDWRFLVEYWGRGVDAICRELGLDEKAAKYCYSRQITYIDQIKLMNNAEEVIRYLKTKYKLGIITNIPIVNAVAVLERFDLTEFFDVIMTIEDVDRQKPDPEIIFKASDRLGCKPENTAIVGDTESDVIAGERAGCIVIGFGIKGEIKIADLSDLLNLL